MDGYTIIDGLAIVIMMISAILAYARGFVREILSIASWIFAALIAFTFAHQIEPFVHKVPVLNDIVANSCQLSLIAAFSIIFAIMLIILSIFIPLFSNVIHRSAIGSIDQNIGFFYGIIRGIFLLLIGLITYSFIGVQHDLIENSKTKSLLADSQDKIESMIKNDTISGENVVSIWLGEKYKNLTAVCK